MKKVISMALASAMVMGMSAVAFGAAKDWDKNTSLVLGQSTSTGWGLNGITLGDKDGYVHPEDEASFYILYNDPATGLRPVTKAEAKAGKLDVQTRVSEGSSVVKSAKIEYDSANNAYVKLTFVDTWVSTKEQDFDLKLYVTVNKARNTDSEFSVTGTFENYNVDVYEGDDYVYTVDTPVINAEDYIKNIQVDMGQGISIYTKMFDGKSYYASVSQDIKSEDDAVLAKYPSIDTVYYLSTINLAGSGDIVKFDLESNFYVYSQDENGDLVYVGRTADKLPYYTKYFLSAKELDITTISDVPSDTDNTTPAAPSAPTGGDDAPIDNVNENPGTGR